MFDLLSCQNSHCAFYCVSVYVIPSYIDLTHITILSGFAANCMCPGEHPNSEIKYTELDSRSSAKYTCLDGYSPVGGSIEIVCQDDGTWSEMDFECKGEPLICFFNLYGIDKYTNPIGPKCSIDLIN